MSCILMLMFLFLTCVLLLNIFIAQLSDRYTSIKKDAEREFEKCRAKIVTRVELKDDCLCSYFGQPFRKKYYSNYFHRRTSCESEYVLDTNSAIQNLATDLKKTTISLAAIQENQEKLQSYIHENQQKLQNTLKVLANKTTCYCQANKNRPIQHGSIRKMGKSLNLR